MKLIKIYAFLLLFSSFAAKAQLQVADASLPPFTPENLITNYFLGDGITVLNVTYEGKNKAVGYFDKAKANIGIQRGIALTTGRVDNDPTNLAVKGIVNGGTQFASTDNLISTVDPDLAKLVPGQTIKDLAKYTITFIPTSDTLRFKYVFGSEEYPEYGCSQFNDVFGFFISGPGINGTFQNNGQNIALIPGTTLPVSIANIHPLYTPTAGTACQPKNAQYFIDNQKNSQPVYDGFTKVFTAEAIVQPCQTYTIKLMIADVGDGIFDSGVFLEAKSFGTGALKVLPSSVSLDGTVVEGCTNGKVTFSLPKKVDDTYDIDCKIIGTAKNGIDYKLIPTKLQIPFGDSSLVIPIEAFEDGIKEGIESIGFDVKIDVCHRDTFWIYIQDNKLVKPNLGKDTLICKGYSFVKDATLPIPLPPPLVFVNKDSIDINTVTPFNPNIPATISNIKVFGVQPTELQDGMIESVCLNTKHQWIDDIDCYLVAPNGQFIALTTDNGGSGGNGAGLDYYKNTCFRPDATVPITSGTVPFTGNYQPEGIWSDLWGVKDNPANGNWKLQILDDQTGAQGKLLDWSITFKPYYRIKYDWTPKTGLSCYDCPNPTFKPTVTTTYIVNASDNYGCPTSDTLTVYVQDSVEAPVVICNVVTHNTIQFAWKPVLFATSYEVSVNNGPWITPTALLTHKIENLALLTTVNIRVRAIGNCGGKIGVGSCQTLNCVSATPSIDVLKNVKCNGLGDGEIKISATGGLLPYSFTLGATSSPTGTFQALKPGKYAVSVTEKAGCVSVVNFTIDEPQKLNLTYQKEDVTCFGGEDGLAIVLPVGGTKPYFYQWSNGATDSLVSKLKKFDYLVTVNDFNGCVGTISCPIFEPAEINLKTVVEDIECYGLTNGKAEVIATKGQTPYTYAWDTNQGLQISSKAVNLVAGKHYVTVSDNNGCKVKTEVEIKSPPQLELTTSGKNVSCFGLKTGQAKVVVKGGNPIYTYLWDDDLKSQNDNLSLLSAGNYKVTVTDSKGCSAESSYKITEPDPIILNLKTNDLLCYSNASGVAEIFPIGGTLPYTIAWSNGLNSVTKVDNLDANKKYTVTLLDQNSCSAKADFTLKQPDSLKVTSKVVTATCNGAATGAIDLTVSGAKKPYTFLWSGNGINANTEDITALKSGIYTVEIRDSNLCLKTLKFNVNEPNSLQVNEKIVDVKCKNENSGSIKLNILGGLSPYNYEWSNGKKVKDIDLLKAGKYQVTVQDAKGCNIVTEYEVKEPSNSISTNITVSDSLCFGQKGDAKIVINGGTSPYDLVWSNGDKTTELKDILKGNYAVVVTDANNCTAYDTAFVYGFDVVKIKLSQTAASCFEYQDGKAKIDKITYGLTPAALSGFNLKWSNLDKGIEVQKLTGGKGYSVTATDNRGCEGVASVTIDQPVAIKVDIVKASLPTCYESKNGEITVNGVGGNPPYDFIWSDKANNQIGDKATNLGAGIYEVTVTDGKGCANKTVVTLENPPLFSLQLKVKDLDCPQTATGAVEVLPKGGTQPYTYSWSNKESKNIISALLSNTYKVTVTDAQGCVKDTSILVNQPPPLDLSFVKEDVKCAGQKNGTFKVVVKGGTSPFTYSLNGKFFTNQNVYSALKPDVYNMVVKDKNGCLFQDDVVINEPQGMSINIGKDSTIFYGDSIKITPIVTDANGKLLYTWSPFDPLFISCQTCESPVIAPKTSTLYTLKVTDGLGCTSLASVNVLIKVRDKIFVPTGFTPNDDQNNDLLLVHGEKGTKILYFSVYDRWGEKIFHTENFLINDPTIGWNGRFRGETSPVGVYTWVAMVEFISGEKRTFKGSTTLLR